MDGDNIASPRPASRRLPLLHRITDAGSLGRRLVSYLLLASALFSVLATVVQLSFSYQRDKAEVFYTFSVVEESFQSGIEKALWEFNFGQVEVLLEGIAAKRDVAFISLASTTGQSWQLGEPGTPNIVRRTLKLTYPGPSDTIEHVGDLYVELSLGVAVARVWAQFWGLALSNFGRTLLISIVLLALLDQFVTRHLTAIAQHVRGARWMDGEGRFVLDRRPPAEPDHLDEIARALNDARSRIGQAFDVMSEEVTERRRAEERLSRQAAELERLNTELEKTNREQAQFTYAISHDLKSPTNTIRMLLDELNAYHREELSADADELIQCADQTARRMSQIVEDVLTYSRVVGLDVAPERLVLSDLAEQVGADLRAEISESGAVLKVGSMPDVMGGQVQLRLMLQNLVSNAIKFARPGVPPEIEIAHAPPDPLGMVRIMVRDNGIGIPPDYRESVFSLFKKLHAQEIYPGTGLGLTLCRRIASNHGGSITVAEQEGPGTTFYVLLPAAGGPVA
ncbi:MAG: ATP-binding protein [Pseudomonadota bacterium]